MTFFDDLGLRAAEQLESSLGAYVALGSYRRMVGSRRPAGTKALSGVLRCATLLGDAAEIQSAVALVVHELGELADLGEREALQAFAAESMTGAIALAKGHGRHALELARGVHERVPTALHAYVVARLEDDAGTRAFEAWFAAVRLASHDPKTDVYRASLARWLEVGLEGGRANEHAVRAEMIDRALAAETDQATPVERLVIARARLLSGSKFQRASGLSLLVDLVRSSNQTVRRHAVLAVARHVDAASRLEPIEHERALAALRGWAVESEREAAEARLALRASVDAATAPTTDQVEALLERISNVAHELRPQVRRIQRLIREPSGPPSSGAFSADGSARDALDVSLSSLSIDALLALRAAEGGGRMADVVAALERAREAASAAQVVPAVAFACVTTALASKDVATRRAASALGMLCFQRRLGAPRQGFTGFGLALARAGLLPEARAVLVEAARLREPGAAQFAGEVERRLGYLALAKGDRSGARELLKSASGHLPRAGS